MERKNIQPNYFRIKNTYTLNANDNRNIFNPTPVKQYRREITNTDRLTHGNLGFLLG